MSRAIYKFPLALELDQHVVMPPGAQLLAVGVQDGQPVLWADVVDDGEYTGRRLVIATTGGCPPGRGTYVGTFTLDEQPDSADRFVGHVYDLGEQTVEGRLKELFA